MKITPANSINFNGLLTLPGAYDSGKQTVNTDKITSIKALNDDTTLISYYEPKVDEVRKVVYDNHHINKIMVPIDVNTILNAYNAAKDSSRMQVDLLKPFSAIN